MRKVVALVETRRQDGRTIASDAFSLNQEPVPVVWTGDFSRPENVMGNASELRLQGNELTMEIELEDRYTSLIDDVEFFIYANKLIERDKRVESGVIKCITAFPYGSKPRIE
jgi:hypothetical protein